MTDNLACIVSERFTADADKVFIVDPAGAEITYGVVAARAAAVVRALEAAGIGRGERIGLLLPHGVDFAVFYFACLLGGITAVPINNALPLKDLSFIIPRSGLKAVVAGPDALRKSVGEASFPQVEHLAQLDTQSLLTTAGASRRDIDALLKRLDPSALLSIHFTSGTTSLPKGVPHRVASLLGNAAAFNETFGLDEACVMLHVMPMAYMAGFLNTLLVPFIAGGRVVLAREFSAQIVPHFWKPIVENKVNTIWVSPSMLAILNKVDRDARGPAYCKEGAFRVFSATAPLAMKVRTAFEEKYGAPVVESYGLSELLLLTANMGTEGSQPYAVGPAITGVQIEIRDAGGNSLPALTDGEVFVKTPYCALGYLDYDTGQPGSANQGWFETGDIGHLDKSGYLFITDRKKDLIIRGGFNISPRVIEELLLQHPTVGAVAVVGAPHEFYGEEVVAVLQLHPDEKLDVIAPHLRAMCQQQLGNQMVPDRFVAVAKFPTSVTGKVLKNALREQLSRSAT